MGQAARSLVGGPERSLDIGDHTRLYALPIVENGVRYGTIVSAVSLDPYEETSDTALIGSVVLGLLILLAVTCSRGGCSAARSSRSRA